MPKGLTEEQGAAMSLIKSIQGLTILVPIDVLSELLDIVVRADTTLPIVHPTFYRDKMREMDSTKECLQAFATYRRELVGLREKVIEKGLLPQLLTCDLA